MKANKSYVIFTKGSLNRKYHVLKVLNVCFFSFCLQQQFLLLVHSLKFISSFVVYLKKSQLLPLNNFIFNVINATVS